MALSLDNRLENGKTTFSANNDVPSVCVMSADRFYSPVADAEVVAVPQIYCACIDQTLQLERSA